MFHDGKLLQHAEGTHQNAAEASENTRPLMSPVCTSPQTMAKSCFYKIIKLLSRAKTK